MYKAVLLMLLLLMALCAPVAAEEGNQTPVKPSAQQRKFPKIILYSVSWCPHCREAKEYFNSHNIPYINKDVEADEAYMDELTTKYKSQGVPLIVIGNDKVILRGFNREKVEQAIGEQK